MSSAKICLASDNWAPAHPAVLQALNEANQGYVPAYGADLWTQQAQDLIQQALGADCRCWMVPTGTGANVTALKIACRRYESVICTDCAHIHYQESGAAEAIIGCKLLAVPHCDGKITPEAVVAKLKSERAFGKHSTAPRVLSIAQPTEYGTVYSLAELKALAQLCRDEKLLFHIDGSRLYNAAAHLGCTLGEAACVGALDLLSLGGTKNGLMGAEALVILNPTLYEGADHLHKQTLGLLSKGRYLAAQYVPLLQNDLWYQLALQANQQAERIADAVQKIPQMTLSCPVQTNQLFFTVPRQWIPQLQEQIFCYPWDAERGVVRFVTSWSTTAVEAEQVCRILAQLN